MMLREASKFGGLDIPNVAPVHFSGSNVSGSDEFSEPRGGEGIIFVVVGTHSPSLRETVSVFRSMRK